ncbi:MAG: chemotaxis protein CheC [Bacillota bacterium]
MQISSQELDVLQEIGNIGVGNAATALANLLQQKIDISVPQARFVSLEETIGIVGSIESAVVCVTLRVEGDIKATVLFIFSEEGAFQLIDLLTGMDPGSTAVLDEMGRSVAMEIGNILTGSFLGAIAELTGMRLTPSVPYLAHDMLGAILPTALAEFGYNDDQVLMIQTTFTRNTGDAIHSKFVLLPDVMSLKQLFLSLGMEQ